MNKSSFLRVVGASALVIGTSVAVALPASAAAGTDKSSDGTCTESSNVRLTVNNGQNDKLKVKAQITSGQRGDQIEYVIADNGNKVKIGNKDTGKKGKTTISAVIRNVEGTDTVVFTSTNTDTLEVCEATVIFNR